MQFGLFKDILDQSIRGGVDVLSVCGFGEALLDKELVKKLQYVKTTYPQVRTYISTTGYLLDDYAFSNIIPLLDEVKISHFSDDEEIFGKMHGKNIDFRTTQKALERLCNLSQDKRPYLNFLFVQTDINKHEMESWITRWEDKVDEIMVWKTHNWAGQWPETQPHSDRDEMHSCGRPFSGDLYVHSDGMVSPCCFDFDGEMIIGDLNEQTLEEVYFGHKMERIRQIHRDNDFTGSGLLCAACDQVKSREDSLVYASNKMRKVGVITSSRLDRINNVLDSIEK